MKNEPSAFTRDRTVARAHPDRPAPATKRHPTRIQAQQVPRIIFEDAHLLVLSKPAGLLSQGEATGDENLVDYLRNYLGRDYIGLVHRLDRNTSGIMVVGKRTKSARRLTESLQAGKILRLYLGWLIGTLKVPVEWTHFLKKDEATNRVFIKNSAIKNDKKDPQKDPGKKSTLTAKPVQHKVYRGQHLTLTEFRLETGRSHQIRVQASHEGFALLGDSKYGPLRAAPAFHRVALHSYFLEFPHPMTGEILKFEDPLPEDLLL